MASHRLAAYRAKRDYSLHEVAWKLRELSRAVDGIDSGPTVKTVWRWERGSTPTARYRRLLCRLYDATAADLGFQPTQSVSAGQRDSAFPSGSRCASTREALLAAIGTIAGLLGHGERRLGLIDVARLDIVTTLYRSLARELKMVVAAVPLLASTPGIATEFDNRLQSIRRDDRSARWTPFANLRHR